MNSRQTTLVIVLGVAVFLTATSNARAQTGTERFSGTASVKTAGNATATWPVTIVIERKMSQKEADSLVAAFKSGGAAAVRKALAGVKPTGTVQLADGKPTPTRVTIERATDKGRLLTLITDAPLLHLGAGVPDAKPKAGYDFAVLDLEVDAGGKGTGTLAPAAKVGLKGDAFVVEDYGGEVVRLTAVQKKS